METTQVQSKSIKYSKWKAAVVIVPDPLCLLSRHDTWASLCLHRKDKRESWDAKNWRHAKTVGSHNSTCWLKQKRIQRRSESVVLFQGFFAALCVRFFYKFKIGDRSPLSCPSNWLLQGSFARSCAARCGLRLNPHVYTYFKVATRMIWKTN